MRRPPVTVVIPWRERHVGLERLMSMRWILSKLRAAHPDWELLVSSDGRQGSQPWSASTARNRGVERATAPVILLLDADTWSPNIDRAVDQVTKSIGVPLSHFENGVTPTLAGVRWAWVQPHAQILRLSRSQSVAFMAGYEVEYSADGGITPDYLGALESMPYRQFSGGVPTVIRKDLYELCPQDPRFNGWGAEDNAWGYALSTLHCPMYRTAGDAVHLWHEPDPVRAQRQAGVPRDKLRGADWSHHELFMRYHDANGNPTRMRALVDEHLAQGARPAAGAPLGVNAQ